MPPPPPPGAGTGTAPGTALLTQKEKAALITKMGGALDRLPEVTAQPLHVLHHRIVLALLRQQQVAVRDAAVAAQQQQAQAATEAAAAAAAAAAGAVAAAATTPMEVDGAAAAPPAEGAPTPMETDAAAPASAPVPAPLPLPEAPRGYLKPPLWVEQATNRSSAAGLMTVDPGLRAEYVELFYGAESGAPRHPGQRLQQLLGKAEWDAVGNRYWPIAVLDVLLTALRTSDPLPRFAPEKEGEDGKEREGPVLSLASPALKAASPAAAGAGAGSKDAAVAAAHHAKAMATLAGARSGLGKALVGSLRLLLHADLSVARALWQPFLSNAWDNLAPATAAGSGAGAGSGGEMQQKDMVPGMVAVLTRGSHRQALALPSYHPLPVQHQLNSVQGLLQGFLSLRPVPNLPPDLLGALAINYNAWTTVLPLIESQVVCSAAAAERQPWVQVLATLYHLMGEHDLRAALRKRYCAMPESRYALSLEAYGAPLEAQTAFFELIQREAMSGAGRASGAGTGGGGGGGSSGAGVGSFRGLPQFELETWEERWIECTRQLSQWPILAEFASATAHPELALECAWKSGDWEAARVLLQGNQLVLQQETGSPAHRVHDARLAAAQGRPPNELERTLGQAFQLALSKWQLLPRAYEGCPNHRPLLHVLHQLHEVKESVAVFDDAMMGRTGTSGGRDGLGAAAAAAGVGANLHLNLKFWRDRVPNDWDPLHEWDDLLYWRLQVFQKIQERRLQAAGGDLAAAAAAAGQPAVLGGMPSDPSRAAPEFQDTAWTMIRLARAARKQGLNDVALNILCRIPLATMAVPDAFGKLREQIAVCHQALRGNANSVGQLMLQGVLPGSAGQAASLAQAGLSIINHTNLEYFTPEQTAELFRLKALFLAAQDQRAEANQAFSHAMQIAGTYGKGWLTWGRYADELFEKEPTNRLVGLNAMACYLEAVSANADGARLLLSRVLQMLLIEEEGGSKVRQSAGDRGGVLACLVGWLMR